MKIRPPIYTRYYDFLGWLLDRTAKFPKNMRFGLVQKIEGIALRLLELFVEAIYRRDRHVLHNTGNIELEKLRVFLRLSHDRALLSADQLRYGHSRARVDAFPFRGAPRPIGRGYNADAWLFRSWA